MRRSTATGEAVIAVGVGLIVLGAVGGLLAFLTDLSLAGGKPVMLLLAGGQAAIIGTMLICYRRLMDRITANSQTLKWEFDMGYEEGWQVRDKAARPSVLVDLEERRRQHEDSLIHS